MTARLAATTVPPRLPKNRPSRSPDRAHERLAIEAGSRGERRDPEEHADEGDALHPDQELRVAGACRWRAPPCRAPSPGCRRATISARTAAGIEAQIASRVDERRLDEQRRRHRRAPPAGRRARTPTRRGAARTRPDPARHGGGSARRRSSGSRSSAGPSSPSRSADRPGRPCRTARPASVATSLFVVTEPKPPIEWPRSDQARPGAGRPARARSASGWRMPRTRVPLGHVAMAARGDRRPRRGRRPPRRATRARPRTTARAGP